MDQQKVSWVFGDGANGPLREATCTVCSVSHDWSREQKNEQQNSVPSPKKQCSCRLSGSSENRALKRNRSTVGRTKITFFSQVFIRGSHIIVSRLSIDVDVQILTNPSLNSGQSSKARYQVQKKTYGSDNI